MTQKKIKKSISVLYRLSLFLVVMAVLGVNFSLDGDPFFYQFEWYVFFVCVVISFLLTYIFDFLVMQVKVLFYGRDRIKMEVPVLRGDLLKGFSPFTGLLGVAVVLSTLLFLVVKLGVPAHRAPSFLGADIWYIAAYLFGLPTSIVYYYEKDTQRAKMLDIQNYSWFKSVLSITLICIIGWILPLLGLYIAISILRIWA